LSVSVSVSLADTLPESDEVLLPDPTWVEEADSEEEESQWQQQQQQ
jgi:hypothetical protein